ncbi:MAG: hypothetical protein Q4E41_10735 [Bacteroidales bacterium]|nr:hypothetical protein [Bacteroidales bacterium]
MKKIKKKKRKRKDPDAPKKIRIKKIKKRPNALIQYLKSIEPKYIPSYIAIVLFCFAIIKRLYLDYKVAQYGVKTVGYYKEVRNVWWMRGLKDQMFYVFTVDGKKYEGMTTDKGQTIGDTLTVRYLPDNPKENCPESVPNFFPNKNNN